MNRKGSLQSHGLNSDLFYNIKDIREKISLVPCSAKTGEGLAELVMMLCGLSQKYLEDSLVLGKIGKGVVLEIKKEKDINYIESILYDGVLKKNDEIAVADIEGNPVITRIRVLEEIKPLSNKFQSKESVVASTGLRIQLTGQAGKAVLPGMPFQVSKNNHK